MLHYGDSLAAHVAIVAFQGIEVLPIDVQARPAVGLPAFAVVGLPDTAHAESRGAYGRRPPVAPLGSWQSPIGSV
jgi:hypothetical protein